MLTEDTMRKLHEMRLTVMARTLREQLQDPLYNDMPFEDRVSLLVDREWCARKNNQLARLKKAAHFADPSACVENIEYHAVNHVPKAAGARSFSRTVTVK